MQDDTGPAGDRRQAQSTEGDAIQDGISFPKKAIPHHCATPEECEGFKVRVQKTINGLAREEYTAFYEDKMVARSAA